MKEVWKVIKANPLLFIYDLACGVAMFLGLYGIYWLLAAIVR